MQRACAILARDKYAAAVRERERFYQQQGIGAVPSVIIDDRHLIRGGQPPRLWLQLGHRLHVHGQVRCQQAAYRRRQLMADLRRPALGTADRKPASQDVVLNVSKVAMNSPA